MHVGEVDVDGPRAALGTLAVAVLVVLVVGAATSATAFGAYNHAWEGTADLRSVAGEAGVPVTVATNASTYADHGNGTVAVVLAPTEPYRPAAIDRIRGFLDRGGTLLVAARNGTAPGLLSALEADARLRGPVLRDDREHYRGPALPVATTVSEHPLTRNVSGLTLNHGTAIAAGDARVLVASSPYGYLDRNGNGRVDDAETLATYPVVTVEHIGAGRLVLVSDPSAFINVMADRPGNRAFLRTLFASGDRVIVDTSHGGGVPPLVAALFAVRRSLVLQFAIAAVGLVAVLAWSRYPVRAVVRGREREPPAAPPAAVADALAARSPAMATDRLRRLMEGIKRASTQPEDDE